MKQHPGKAMRARHSLGEVEQVRCPPEKMREARHDLVRMWLLVSPLVHVLREWSDAVKARLVGQLPGKMWQRHFAMGASMAQLPHQ